jgi:hypothetical protein
MTNKELEIKAKEYANKTQFTEYDNSSLSESLDISEELKQAYIAGAKENQPTVEEMLKRLLKGGYVKSGIYEKKEHAQQWHIVVDGDLPKEKKEYWCKVFYYESEETFNAFLWFDPSSKEFKFLDNIGEDEVSGFNVKEWCEIPEE